MPDSLRILVVDDHEAGALAVAGVLRGQGFQVQVANDGEGAIAEMARSCFDIVLTDLCMEPVDGLAVVKAARSLHPPPEVIVFTGFGTVENAVEAMRLGARDFLTKPVAPEILLHRIQGLRDSDRPGQDVPFVGESSFAVRFREDLIALAQVRSTVLVCGETGTGRTHVARLLHAHGPQANLPFRTLHVTPDLVPSDLEGLGTVLVPRVDSLGVEQARALLRILDLHADDPPRIVATAHPSAPREMMASPEGADLYFRLAVIALDLPPLRERSADLPLLIRHFAQLHGASLNREPVGPSQDQWDGLAHRAWPGNVQEVSNLVQRALVFGGTVYELPEGRPHFQPPIPEPSFEGGFNLQEWVDQVERSVIIRAFKSANGDRREATRILGINRATLKYKLEKYGLLERPEEA